MSRSRHLVDPELLPLLDAFPTVSITGENLAQLRARDLPMPQVENCGVDWDEHSFEGPASTIGVRIYRPRSVDGPLGCIFHIHGGGYVGGSVAEVEFLHRPLAAELGCAIISVDYRLAPETAFPGNIEDCYAALAWTFGHASEHGIDKSRIGLMGESAGGGLCAALALMARDRGDHALAFQHLIYPMLDDRTCVSEPNLYSGEFIWHAENNLFGWTALLGEEPGGQGVSPYASPARASDLSGLPPTFIGTAALDLFVDENIEFARRLNRAGVPTELHVYPGGMHGFDIMPVGDVATAAQAARLAALKRALA